MNSSAKRTFFAWAKRFIFWLLKNRTKLTIQSLRSILIMYYYVNMKGKQLICLSCGSRAFHEQNGEHGPQEGAPRVACDAHKWVRVWNNNALHLKLQHISSKLRYTTATHAPERSSSSPRRRRRRGFAVFRSQKLLCEGTSHQYNYYFYFLGFNGFDGHHRGFPVLQFCCTLFIFDHW